MYRYETHLHTSPISACAKASVEESLIFYKSIGYDGVFITDHFLDGNTSVDRTLVWEEKISRYFSSYEEALALSEKIGIKVFSGVEMGRQGSHFLVYGLGKEWYTAHPEIMEMKMSEELNFLRENGAYVVHAHPFREDHFIDHVNLYPRHVHGVEIVNASRNDFENNIAKMYAEYYGLTPFAGSDNHSASNRTRLAGMCSETPVNSIEEFIEGVKSGSVTPFEIENPLT